MVGVDSDAKIRRRKGEDRPMVPEDERLELLAHQRPVDLIYLKQDDDPAWGLIKAVEPDVLVLTADHSYTDDELAQLGEIVGEIEVIERQASVTTLERIRQMYMNLGDKLGPKLAQVLPGLIDETILARAMTEVVLAYVPGPARGLPAVPQRHARGRPLYLIGPELYADYRPLAKDIRALTRELVRDAIAAWGIARRSRCWTWRAPQRWRLTAPSIVLPAEDVSYQVVERYFPRARSATTRSSCAGTRRKTVQLLDPQPVASVAEDVLVAELEGAAKARPRAASTGGARSAPRCASPTARSDVATNVHHPARARRLRRRRPAQQLHPGRRAGALDRHARRGRADRRRRARRPCHRRRDDLRHRLPLPAVREADRRRGYRQALLPPRLRGPRRA